jgi:hypothetical protein
VTIVGVWYQTIATGLGIPAALLGALISWNLIKKTRLESKKLDLEIKEKEAALKAATTSEERIITLSHPIFDVRLGILILIRYVMFDLIMNFWSLVPNLISYTIRLFAIEEAVRENWWSAFLIYIAAPQALRMVYDIIYWIPVFGIGLPLLKDTCIFLNIPMKSLLSLPKIVRGRGSI